MFYNITLNCNIEKLKLHQLFNLNIFLIDLNVLKKTK